MTELPIDESLWPAPPSREETEKALKALEEGPWPSHVAELRRSKYPIHLYGMGLVAKATPWASSVANAPGIFAGVLSRVSHPWTRMDPPISEDHERIIIPSAQVVSTIVMRELIRISRQYGWALFQLIGGTGDIVMNVERDKIIDAAKEVRRIGLEVGGSGDVMRNSVACPGPLLCEYAIYDTLRARDMTYECFLDWASYPQFPYKIKFKFSGCPIDCLKAQARADYVFIGTWRGAPDVNEEALNKWMEEGGSIDELVKACPTGAIEFRNGKLSIDGGKCVQCMECIKRAYPAISPGRERGIRVLLGGTIKSRNGPKLAKVLVPFIPLRDSMHPDDEVMKVFELLKDKVVPKWDEIGWRRERIGDVAIRLGWRRFVTEVANLDPKGIVKDGGGREPYYMNGIPFFIMSDEDKKAYLNELGESMKDWD